MITKQTKPGNIIIFLLAAYCAIPLQDNDITLKYNQNNACLLHQYLYNGSID